MKEYQVTNPQMNWVADKIETVQNIHLDTRVPIDVNLSQVNELYNEAVNEINAAFPFMDDSQVTHRGHNFVREALFDKLNTVYQERLERMVSDYTSPNHIKGGE